MREALNGFVIRGICSNIPFQAALLAHPKFVAGDFNTGFIAEHFPQGLLAPKTCRTTTRTSCVALAAVRATARYLRARGRHQRPAAGARAADRRATSSSSRAMRDGRARAHAGAACALDGDAFVVDVGGAALRASRSTGAAARHRRRAARCNGAPFTAQVERLGPGLPRRRTTARRSTRRCCRRAPPSCTR